MVLGSLVERDQVLHDRLLIGRCTRAVKRARGTRDNINLVGAHQRSIRIVGECADVLLEKVALGR